MALETDSSGSANEARTVNIRLFTTHEAAAQAAANLEAHGIKCWVHADDCGGMYPNLTAAAGVRLHVMASDAEAAIALLDEPLSTSQKSESSPAEDFIPDQSDQTKSSGVKKFSLGAFIVGIFFGVIFCLLYQWTNQSGTKAYYHYGKDRKADEAWIYIDGKLIEYKRDRNHDQKWDDWYYYDGNGDLVRADADNNFDGKLDEFLSYADDELVSSKRDTDFNGTPDEFYSYSNSMIQQLDMKPNGLRYSKQRDFYKTGVLTEEWRGGDSNSNFKTVVRYDPFMEPISTNVFNLLTPSEP